MSAQSKRTKKAYIDLYNDPGSMFDGCQVILFPNGIPEIWIKPWKGNHGVRIRASNGPAGMRTEISAFAGTTPLTIPNNDDPDGGYREDRDISVTQYNADEWAQKFREWYHGNGPHPGEKEKP